MCLYRLTDKSEFPESGVGFKALCPNANKESWSGFFARDLKFDTWLQASGRDIQYGDDIFYPSGFHFFTREGDCEHYMHLMSSPQCWVQIQYRGLIAAGYEVVEYRALVAREILVPSITIKCRSSYPSSPRFVKFNFIRPRGFWYRNYTKWETRLSEPTDPDEQYYVPCLYNEKRDAVYLT